MSSDADIHEICQMIQRDYSPCDISDALIKLKAPAAGFLADIASIKSSGTKKLVTRVVAPASTLLFVPKSGDISAGSKGTAVPSESNLPAGKHFSDCLPPGTIAVMQQPGGQIVAAVGDIIATRLQYRGLHGIVVDGRTRDIESCAEICNTGEYQIWTRGLSAVGTSLEAKPWAIDVPLQIGSVCVKPGDIVCADEAEGVISVLPRELLQEFLDIMPGLKEASDKVIALVKSGMSLPDAIERNPGFYSNYS